MPRLRRDRRGEVLAGELVARDQRDLHRRGVADDLRQDARHVVEIADGAQAAVEPRRIRRTRAHHRARLALGDKAAVHGVGERVGLVDDQRLVVEVVGIAKRRNEHHRADGPGLVLVIVELREPVAIHRLVDVGRLGLCGGVAVAIVVVADILLVEDRNRLGADLVRVAHVPVGDQLQPVGIGVDEEGDVIVEEAPRLLVIAGQQVVDDLDVRLAVHHLGGVHAGVDPHGRLALAGERVGLVIGQPLGQRQLARDLLLPIEIGKIRGRRDDRHPLLAPFRGLADRDELHAIALAGDLVQPLPDLRIVGEKVVGARRAADHLLGIGDAGARRRRELRGGGSNGGKGQKGGGEQDGAHEQLRLGRYRSAAPQPRGQAAQRAAGGTSTTCEANRSRWIAGLVPSWRWNARRSCCSSR